MEILRAGEVKDRLEKIAVGIWLKAVHDKGIILIFQVIAIEILF